MGLGTNLGAGNGVQQWIFQRFSNIVLIIFALALATVLLSDLSYQSLTDLLSQTWFKVYLTFTLVIGSLNSVLAGWQIAGDYAHKMSLPSWTLTGLVGMVTLIYFILSLTLIF
jgi:succinate dehydrogenase / fumarate reductase membrane anchor subunit